MFDYFFMTLGFLNIYNVRYYFDCLKSVYFKNCFGHPMTDKQTDVV